MYATQAVGYTGLSRAATGRIGGYGRRRFCFVSAGANSTDRGRYSSVAELEDRDSCRPHRGQDHAPLFLLNHWVSPPSTELAAEVNHEDVLLARAERCAEERGRPVNLVAVDFYDSGDLFPTVDELNGVAAASD